MTMRYSNGFILAEAKQEAAVNSKPRVVPASQPSLLIWYHARASVLPRPIVVGFSGTFLVSIRPIAEARCPPKTRCGSKSQLERAGLRCALGNKKADR